jgi:hypothetical protein
MINKEELILIKAGASKISGTFINSIVKLGNLIFDIGKSLGSSIRRTLNKNYC